NGNPNFKIICQGQGTLFGGSSFDYIFKSFSYDTGDLIYNEIVDFANAMVQVGIQIIGLLFSLLISYDLMDNIADIIGAPSLDSRKIMSRVL
ncbi:MAG: hypothetical protein KGH50_04115, partial [Candidatus Micrarchaeota archaeon]|nr:hypothetical protein [Candidatus Micrarchaeota archaeon]